MGMTFKGKGHRYISGGAHTRGTQAMGEKYHDHCQCIVVPIWANVAMPLDIGRIDRFEAMYKKAGDDAHSGDPKKILASMRQIYGLR